LRECEEQGVTVLDLPTAYWHELTAEEWLEGLNLPEGVRLVIIGGEKAQREGVEGWQERVRASVRLVNTYGPTEATIVATMCDVPVTIDGESFEVPLGRPLPNVEVYICDKQMQPVPVGVTGELYIGGEGLARGYRNRPELTAERFIPHPFGRARGERLYRTGDLGRYRVDGQIEFMGRSDNQVKVRGFRIELGEIEAALNQHRKVRSCVVISHERAIGDSQLVAYVVAQRETAPTVTELREHLKNNLPDYMIPATFMILDSFPLTSSGKLDRRALPAPQSGRSESDSPFVAPRTPTEKELCEIWRELLKVERVSVYDNFFELGGHSLLLTRMASSIRNVFQVNLTIPILFNGPTIVEMTEAIAVKQVERENADEMAHMLRELQQLSSDEVRSLLEAEES
jgi:acyl-CoA synthetase (AMP-forming)/AMP-acid ligase II